MVEILKFLLKSYLFSKRNYRFFGVSVVKQKIEREGGGIGWLFFAATNPLNNYLRHCYV